MIFYDVCLRKRSFLHFREKQSHCTDLFLFLRYHHNARVCEEKEERRRRLSRRHVVWGEDARAEKEDWGARRVGFDREVRRHLFQTHSSEIE